MRRLMIVLVLTLLAANLGSSANYMYEKSSEKGIGHMAFEKIVSTQSGFNGQKLVERGAGSGSVTLNKWELEAERQLDSAGNRFNCSFPNDCGMDYINYTKEAEFEYMPVSYQTGNFDAKWVDKLLCAELQDWCRDD